MLGIAGPAEASARQNPPSRCSASRIGSSCRIYAWPGVGPAVEAFLSHGVIARRGKVGAIVGMTFGGLLVALTPLAPAARLITLAVIALAALYVATRPESLPQALPAERN